MSQPKRAMFGRFKRLHFIGIGGIGMSGIAEILLNRGFEVTGSDRTLTEVTDRLTQLGAIIFEGHQGSNVEGADVVVYSSAVTTENEEMKAAERFGIPTIRRAVMLAELMRMKYGIGIAGTHGKTTTTSMTGIVLAEAGLDPTIVVGGKVNHLDSNAKVGEGDYIVVEADEYDRSFLTLTPTIAVITTLEAEHLDIYHGGLDDIKKTFVEYANKVPFFGIVICCLDEANIQDVIPSITRRIMTYGLTPHADLRAIDMIHDSTKSRFGVSFKGELLGEVELHVPGLHNIKNALAAIGVGLELEIPFEKIKSAIEKFEGVQRRFQVLINSEIMVVDDYAHHPTEVKVVLEAVRNGWKKRRLVAVFQPHLYSRTKDFYEDFGRVFLNCDKLIVLDVYASREEPIENVSGELISHAAKKFGHRDVTYVPNKQTVAELVTSVTKSGDIIVCMGAGDITKIAKNISEMVN